MSEMGVVRENMLMKVEIKEQVERGRSYIILIHLMFQNLNKGSRHDDQMEEQQTKYKMPSFDKSARKKSSTIARLTENLEKVQTDLRIAEGRVKNLLMAGRSREAVMDTLKDEWTEQEERIKSEHQVKITWHP